MMVKHNFEYQFRMNDVKKNDENGKNNAKVDGMSSRIKKSTRAVTKNETMSQHFCAKLIRIKTQTVGIVSKCQNLMIVMKNKQPSHQTFRWQQIIKQKTILSCAAVEIFCKIDRHFVFNDDKFKKMFVVTIHGLRMTKTASDISIVIKSLSRCERYKTIYRKLNVTGQKDFCFGENF